MRFGRVLLAEADGAVLAHTLRHPGGVVKKGTVLGGEELAALREAGLERVLVARLEPGDVDENAAAARLARAAAGPGLRVGDPFTGRANVYAEERGLALVDGPGVDALNGLRESLTLATLRPFTRVEAGDLVATAKVIPFGVSSSLLEEAEERARRSGAPLRVVPFEARNLGMILTELPGTKEKVLRRAEETMRVRVSALGSRLERVARCAHDEESVADVLEEMLDEGLGPVLLLGASAVVDRGDVLPGAVEAVAGTVEHFGLPVDPGNLLLLARRGEVPILGVPGCARSPRRSGFDLVLERLLAGLEVTSRDLMELGVGGLLKEIPTRPQPRTGRRGGKVRPGARRAARVGAVVLAAGRSRRMDPINKLLTPVEGTPMVARVVDALLESPARPVVVVTGHQAEDVGEALEGRAVRFAHNAEHEEGMGSSLRTGVEALEEEEPGVDGAVICLADMPRVRPHHVAALVRAFDPKRGRTICVPVHDRKRGHPVLFGARHFTELRQVTGDVGAREVLARHDDAVAEVPVDDPGVLVDVDTREALEALEDPEG